MGEALVLSEKYLLDLLEQRNRIASMRWVRRPLGIRLLVLNYRVRKAVKLLYAVKEVECLCKPL